MQLIERLIIDFFLIFVSAGTLRDILGNPQIVSIIIGTFVAGSASLLGVWLVVRKMSLTAGAISRTVLLGIVGMFILLTDVLNQPGDLESPLLIVGAALAGLATVYLTELIFSSGLVKEDAALGLVYPLLFAVSLIAISEFVDDVHLDQDSVMLGEIGIAWLDFNEHCLENCDTLIITEDSPAARFGRECINCEPSGEFRPQDEGALFQPICLNCGELPASIAYNRGYTDLQPELIFFPKAITTTGLTVLINLLFVGLFFKYLKIATFDSALASALGLRPGLWMYGLMLLVSVTTVTAFSAVGAILIVAFFIVPPATAYLLTDRAAYMVFLSGLFGALSVITGYQLSQGRFLGIFKIESLLVFLDNNLLDLQGYTAWNTNVAGSIVTMTGFFFLLTWIISPRYGVLSTMIRRRQQSQQFAEQMLLIFLNKQEKQVNPADLADLLQWTGAKTQRILKRAISHQVIRQNGNTLELTENGREQIEQFTLQ